MQKKSDISAYLFQYGGWKEDAQLENDEKSDNKGYLINRAPRNKISTAEPRDPFTFCRLI